jgi:hypothetical protein
LSHVSCKRADVLLIHVSSQALTLQLLSEYDKFLYVARDFSKKASCAAAVLDVALVLGV